MPLHIYARFFVVRVDIKNYIENIACWVHLKCNAYYAFKIYKYKPPTNLNGGRRGDAQVVFVVSRPWNAKLMSSQVIWETWLMEIAFFVIFDFYVVNATYIAWITLHTI